LVRLVGESVGLLRDIHEDLQEVHGRITKLSEELHEARGRLSGGGNGEDND
jgi:hypothetical protein